MSKSKIDKFEDFHPIDRKSWRNWLSENHDKLEGIWFVYYKKITGKPFVPYEDAVEEALCFGWIDSIPRKFDQERSKLLFTPRKPKSVWSKLNKIRVENLIKNGEMTEVGLSKIEQAKKDGSWNALDASDNLEIQADLAKAFGNNKYAKGNFNNFTDAVKRNILAWIYSAKTEKTRAKRIEKALRMAERNLRVNYDKDI